MGYLLELRQPLRALLNHPGTVPGSRRRPSVLFLALAAARCLRTQRTTRHRGSADPGCLTGGTLRKPSCLEPQTYRETAGFRYPSASSSQPRAAVTPAVKGRGPSHVEGCPRATVFQAFTSSQSSLPAQGLSKNDKQSASPAQGHLPFPAQPSTSWASATGTPLYRDPQWREKGHPKSLALQME